MRIVFVVENNPITRNGFGGICAVIYGHLEMLSTAGHEVHLVMLQGTVNPGAFERYLDEQPETWERVSGWVASFTEIPEPPTRPRRRSESARLLFTDLDQFLKPRIGAAWVDPLAEVVMSRMPDVIFAEHRVPAILALRAFDGPVVFGHVDWEWRLMALRPAYRGYPLRKKASRWLTRLAETRLVRAATACACVSATEAADIGRLRGRAEYFPVTYEPIERFVGSEASKPARIVHLGGMAATASREGLVRFVEVVLPEVRARLADMPEFVVVGDMSNAPPALLASLDEVGATQTGFVPDLDTVLRTGDIAVVPWEHDTGARTKVPLLMRHGHAVVAVAAGVAGMPEAVRALVTVPALDDMAAAIADLANSDVRRLALAHQAQSAFTEQYTNEAVAPRMASWLDDVVAASHRRAKDVRTPDSA